MSTTVVTASSQVDPAAVRRRSIALVCCCTILGAAAQIFMKWGANHLANPGLIGMATNMPLMVGYTLYGFSTVLLVLALKDGELSLLYPVIALTYVWVTALSFLIFHDHVNAFKVAGIVIIVAGVVVLSRGDKK